MWRKVLLLGVMLGVLEMLARLVMGGIEQSTLYLPLWGTPGPCVRLRPGAEVEYTGWFLKIPPVKQEVNTYGYRGPERPPARRPGVLRIAAVGDSYTYGMGVRTEQSIPAQL